MTTQSATPQGVWAWIWQRITAVLLVVLLGTHLAVLHYVDENLSINFFGVAARFKSVLYLIIDSGLLVFGLYHGLNGVRNVLFDFVVDENKRRALTALMWIVLLGFAGWGAYALMFFVTK
ncbi:MAG: succinate dehydrogenase, hydrophobic membrane anchor protein [Chloroflexi bacterium]|nr:succinate dehydrogenase, hydrophobic membrane anchor protein [Chloroflexota bacterium]